jgi:hypothetical protein
MSTRIDETKYNQFFDTLASKIKDLVPGAVVIKNMVPKEWAMADIYC